jgi:gluconate kinase
MKKLLIALPTAALMIGAVATPSFSEQSEEGMKNREARRQMHFMMLQMVDGHMQALKTHEAAIVNYKKLLEMMYENENKNTRDGQN